MTPLEALREEILALIKVEEEDARRAAAIHKARDSLHHHFLYALDKLIAAQKAEAQKIDPRDLRSPRGRPPRTL